MNTILKPALHTLWQALVAALVTWYASVNLGAVHNVDDAKKLALSALVAVGAALLSALLHVAKQYGPTLISTGLRGKVDKNEMAMIDAVLDSVSAEQAPPTA